jgi:hypothetical protein
MKAEARSVWRVLLYPQARRALDAKREQVVAYESRLSERGASIRRRRA